MSEHEIGATHHWSGTVIVCTCGAELPLDDDQDSQIITASTLAWLADEHRRSASPASFVTEEIRVVHDEITLHGWGGEHVRSIIQRSWDSDLPIGPTLIETDWLGAHEGSIFRFRLTT